MFIEDTPGEDRIGIWRCWFLRRGENGIPREKRLGARTRNNNKINPHMAASPVIDPAPY